FFALYPSSATDDVDVEMRIAYDTPEPHPEREKHFCAARVGDVAEVDDVCGLPAEPFAKPVGDFPLCRCIVAADEQVVVTGHARWFDHDVAVYGGERVHHALVADFALDFSAERVGVADCQRWRHSLGKIERVADLDKYLAGQVGC